ncbi:MAG TPA: hypothetical protein VF509_14560 [Sphingobium sp.]
MAKRKPNRFIALWKAELKAAEAAVDHVTEMAHRMLARHYARLAAADCSLPARY